MRYILLPIHPKWCEKILNGDKSIEVRKGTTLHKVINNLIKVQGKAPCLIYCTKGKDILLMEEDYDYGSMSYYAPQPVLIEKPTRKPREDEIDFCAMYDYYASKNFKDTEHEWKLNGKVFAEFEASAERIIVRKIWGEYEAYGEHINFTELSGKSCLSQKQIIDYVGESQNGTAIHIHSLKTFDKPKELKEFKHPITFCPLLRDSNFVPSFCKDHCEHNKDPERLDVYCDRMEKDWKPLTKAPQSWCYAQLADDHRCL